MASLSVIVITRNESADIEECLSSVSAIADEVVVVDNHSDDGTPEKAAGRGARVVTRAFDGFGPQKQFALEQARCEWALNIDADERVSPALAEEIKTVLSGDPGVAAYRMPFQLWFMGRRLRFGGCGGETHVRLFRRARARYPAVAVHEAVEVDGPVGDLRSPVLHLSYRNLDEYLAKCRTYTRAIAKRKHESGRRFRVWHHARLPWEFVVRYVFKAGFLDGTPGFTYAVLSAFYAWLKHVRMIDFERGDDRD